MKAIQIAASGGPEVLTLFDVTDPVAGDGEVVVRAHAIGVGKPDVLFRTGVYRWRPPLPAVPGAEMAGRIETVGRDVTHLSVGQPVLVYRFQGGWPILKCETPGPTAAMRPAISAPGTAGRGGRQR